MKKVLIMAVALGSMFATQQAFAKKSTKNTTMSSKKHHKKAKKAANTVAPTGQAAPVVS
jgi:hypothetical protein